MKPRFTRLPHPEPEHRSGTAPNGLPYESVWSYPRPPEIRPESRTVSVDSGDTRVALSKRALKVCETAGAPVIYIPLEDVDEGLLAESAGRGSYCEWKGAATYFDLKADGQTVPSVAWTYRAPSPGFEPIAGLISFYPALLQCRLGDELVRPQAGGFYGGWVTDEITGPIKGTPGSEGW